MATWGYNPVKAEDELKKNLDRDVRDLLRNLARTFDPDKHAKTWSEHDIYVMLNRTADTMKVIFK